MKFFHHNAVRRPPSSLSSIGLVLLLCLLSSLVTTEVNSQGIINQNSYNIRPDIFFNPNNNNNNNDIDAPPASVEISDVSPILDNDGDGDDGGGEYHDGDDGDDEGSPERDDDGENSNRNSDDDEGDGPDYDQSEETRLRPQYLLPQYIYNRNLTDNSSNSNNSSNFTTASSPEDNYTTSDLSLSESRAVYHVIDGPDLETAAGG